MAELSVAPPAPIFEKVTDPLYIVLDEVPEGVSGGHRAPELLEVRSFALGPLKATLSPYFDDIVVMEDSTFLPRTPHLELWVKVQELGSRRVGDGLVDDVIARSVPTLEWEAVLVDRVVGAVPFTYTANLEGNREMSMVAGTSQAFAELFELALSDLATELVMSGTVRRLREGPPVQPVELPDLACPDPTGGDAVSEAR